MRRSFDARARRAIQAALNSRAPSSDPRAADRSHDPVGCPVCGGPLTESPIATPAALPYVRSRVMVVCPACELGAVVDVRSGVRP